MEEPSLVDLISDPMKVGGILGGVLIAIKIYLNFDAKKILRKFHRDDVSENPQDVEQVTSIKKESSCVIHKDQCEIYREQFFQKIDIEIRSKMLELKIDIQKYISEEIRRSGTEFRSSSEISRDLDAIFENYIIKKYGNDKRVLK